MPFKSLFTPTFDIPPLFEHHVCLFNIFFHFLSVFCYFSLASPGSMLVFSCNNSLIRLGCWDVSKSMISSDSRSKTSRVSFLPLLKARYEVILTNLGFGKRNPGTVTRWCQSLSFYRSFTIIRLWIWRLLGSSKYLRCHSLPWQLYYSVIRMSVFPTSKRCKSFNQNVYHTCDLHGYIRSILELQEQKSSLAPPVSEGTGLNVQVYFCRLFFMELCVQMNPILNFHNCNRGTYLCYAG